MNTSGSRQTVTVAQSRTPVTAPAAHERRHELDWLRAGAVLGLIPFHVAVIFTTGSGDYIKNAETSGVMDMLTSLISFWGIPLIFLLAGAGAWFALAFRSSQQFAKERLLRLGIPLLFGIFAIVPLQAYLGHLSQPGRHMSLWAFYLDHLAVIGSFLFRAQIPSGNDVFSHLWFIPLLLLFSIITLPAFAWLRAHQQRPAVRRLALFLERRIALLALGLILGLVIFFLTIAQAVVPALPNLSPLVLFFAYLFFYCFGYLLYALPGLTKVVVRAAPLALGVGVVLWVALRVAITAQAIPSPTATWHYLLYCLAQGVISWVWVIAIQGYGIRFLTFTSRLLRYLNKATYPVYVLHMAVLTALALPIVRWDLPWPVKFVIILAGTFVVTLALYDGVIRRVALLRWLFGMKYQVTSED